MTDIEFFYKGSKTVIQCKEDEKMENNYKKFATKTGEDLNSLYFLYGGNKINEENTFEEIANEEDKKRKKMNILVCEEEVNDSKSYIIKSKEIICPKCNENCKINIEEFKIFLKCRNGHKTNSLFFDEYEKSQNIDISKIICEKCQQNKSETYENAFYKCNSCKIYLCPLCKSDHDKTHKIINYDQRHYICEIHCENINSYCKKCKQNLCIYCEKEHNNHNKINIGELLPINENLKLKLDELRIKIDKMKSNVEEIKNILNKYIEIMENFFKLNNDIINNFDNKKLNYEILYNIKEITNNNILKDLDNILNENNMINKFTNIYNNYKKIITKDPDNIVAYYNIKEKDSKIRIFGKEFVKNNVNNCKIEVEGKEYDLIDIFNLNNCSKRKETLKVKLKGIQKLTNISYLFDGCSLSPKTNLSFWNTINITDMSYTFYNIKSQSLPDISNWNTSNVTNMSYMFAGCCKLEFLPDISKWNTSKVTNMSSIFKELNLLKELPDISNWDTSNVESMDNMFCYDEKLTSFPDISKWNTIKVKNMSYMFQLCESLKSLPDIEKWNTSNLKKITWMFSSCPSLEYKPDFSKKLAK